MSWRIISFLLLFFCNPITGNAVQVNHVDTTHCTVQKFNQQQLNNYRKQRDFAYETVHAESDESSSALSYLLEEFFDHLNHVHVGSISLYDVMFYGLAVFAAVMIVLQFFKISFSSALVKNPGVIITHKAFTENVHELDFDELLRDALKNTNYRLATRIYYLKTLKKLSDTGLINWQKNKTNFEYYYELKGAEQRKDFYHLTSLFESVWYGNHEITASDFDLTQGAFNSFLQTIKR